MTTHEKLSAIRAKCVELLEHKDNGFVMPAGYVGRNAVKGEYYRAGYFAGIASCAGPAEAGWKATIAAIDLVFEMQRSFTFQHSLLRKMESEIISAWEGLV